MKLETSDLYNRYMNTVIKLAFILTPLSSIISSGFITFTKISRTYLNISWIWLNIFDAFAILTAVLGIVFFFTCKTSNETINTSSLLKCKILLAATSIFQTWFYLVFTTIDYFIFIAFLLLIAISLLDNKFFGIIISFIPLSFIIAWIFGSYIHIPANNILVSHSLLLRILYICLISLSLYIFFFLIIRCINRFFKNLEFRDKLTHLQNRRSLDLTMDKWTVNYQRTLDPITAILCDLDDFKVVNGKYGRDCGDYVLKKVSEIIKENVRKEDIVFRYGGEEIFVLLSANKDKTIKIAERIKLAVASSNIEYNGDKINITLTIGISSYKTGDDAEALYKKADLNVYYGKKNGKNTISA